MWFIPFFLVVYYIWIFAVLVPSIAIITRRMHDVNKSAAWWLITIIPFVNILFFLYLIFNKGTVGPNKYGEDTSQLFEFFCPECDTKVIEEANFCRNCGIDFD